MFGRFDKQGVEEDVSRSVDLESTMPNFVRRPREKPTFIPVDMQVEYETADKKKEPWEVVAEGFGD